MGSEETRERFDSAVITCVIVTAVIWAGLNWPWEYVAAAQSWAQPPQSYDLNVELYSFNGCEKVQAGFPFQYWMREPDDELGTYAYWSPAALAVNALLGLILVGLAGWIGFRISSHRNAGASQLPTYDFRSRLAFSSVLLLGFAAIAGFCVKRNEKERTLEGELSKHAVTVSYAVVPKPLAGMTPKLLMSSFARVRAVVMCRKNPEALAMAVTIPTLHTLGSYREAPTAEQIRYLAQNGRLKHLIVRRTEIAEDTKQAIFETLSLRRLDLVMCRGLEKGWDKITNLTRLQTLVLTESDVRLSLLPDSNWPKTLTRLNLSRPREGTDSLTLRGLKTLTSLSLQRTDAAFNRELLRINLEDLPRLEYLGLETMQRITITIKSAPRLKNIGYVELDAMQRGSGSDALPTSLWLRELHLEGVQSLTELNCDGLDLKAVTLKRVPNLKRLTLGRYGFRGGNMYRKATAATPASLQLMVNSLAKCDGPTSLDLSSLPLNGVDLTPLAENKKIRRLELMDCGIDGSQSPVLARLSGLTELDLRGCPLDDKDAARLLSMNPNLRSLLVSSQAFSTIEVVDRSSLRAFIATESPNARVVKIANSPQLEAELILGDDLETLQVREGRSLQGLSVNGPIPEQCQLHGFRALKFFAIGGSNVDDELCEDLWQCAELDHLTIAYGNLSKQALKYVGRFDRLTALALPGSAVDDEIVSQHWQALTMLSDVNLSETKVSSGTIEFLAGLKNLQKLSVAYCNAQPEDLMSLIDVDQLIELDVAGIGLTSDCLIGCLRRGMLDRLDLSDSRLSEELIDVLAGPAANSLLFLGLKNCKLSEADLQRISDAHPRLAFDITGTPIKPTMIAKLRDQKRLLDRTDRDGFLRHLANGEHYLLSDLKAELDPVRGRIDYRLFAKEHLADVRR
jgi:hypothetical protein